MLLVEPRCVPPYPALPCRINAGRNRAAGSAERVPPIQCHQSGSPRIPFSLAWPSPLWRDQTAGPARPIPVIGNPAPTAGPGRPLPAHSGIRRKQPDSV